jgi:hypothetical protein
LWTGALLCIIIFALGILYKQNVWDADVLIIQTTIDLICLEFLKVPGKATENTVNFCQAADTSNFAKTKGQIIKNGHMV